MNSSSSSSSREKYLLKVISPAIKGKTCPICLKELHNHREVAVLTVCLHAYCLGCIKKWSYLKRKCPLCNAAFNTLLYKISFSSRTFLTEKLPEVECKGKNVTSLAQFRIPQRVNSRRSRAFPWRRTFGRPGSVSDEVIAERKLQWRASVYKRGLKAVPLSQRNSLRNVARDGYAKENVLQRIQPWIQRELQAILEDPDPVVIVHVASSLFFSNLERKSDVRVEDSFLAPLRPFLRDWTDMFWHELRCFAETALNMETYDAVVEYVSSD